jgi:DNA-binding MarR family transcriptional regulator
MIDIKRQAELRQAIEQFYFAYRGFTEIADRILAQRGLGRVHHRVLYFIGRKPQLAVKDLLLTLGVSKQALNAPLRQLVEMGLVAVTVAPHDRRIKQLALTLSGEKLEGRLTALQMQHLEDAFVAAGPTAEAGWRAVMAVLIEHGSRPKS